MSVEVFLGNKSIRDGEYVPLRKSKRSIQLSLNRVSPDQLYTLMIYDMNAPAGSPFLHFLEVNIPGNRIDKGNVLMSYVKPSPPAGSGVHHYIIDLFQQNQSIPRMEISSRPSFPVVQFVNTYGLQHVDRFIFRTSSSNSGQMDGNVVLTEGLSEPDAKYCDCIIDVQAQKSKAKNPYAICHYSIEGESGRPKCSEYYVFDRFTLDQLIAYITERRIPLPPPPYTKEGLIQYIKAW